MSRHKFEPMTGTGNKLCNRCLQPKDHTNHYTDDTKTVKVKDSFNARRARLHRALDCVLDSKRGAAKDGLSKVGEKVYADFPKGRIILKGNQYNDKFFIEQAGEVLWEGTNLEVAKNKLKGFRKEFDPKGKY